MKLDFQAIERYAKQYAAKVCDDFFYRNNTISGQQIMKLSNVAQINTFVIADLYETWKVTAEAFKSPYFDFSNEEVKAALQTFMNTVSHQISVTREHFEPLLIEAVKKTISLLLDPSKYFDDYLRDSPDFSLTQERVNQLVKYTKINGVFAKGLKEKLGDTDKVYVTTALNWLNEIANETPFESPDKYLDILSATVPVAKADFEKKTKLNGNGTSPELPTPGSGWVIKSFFDHPVENETDTDDDVLPTVATVQAKIDKEGIALEEAPVQVATSLNDSFSDDLPTVNDLLKKELIGQTTLSDLAFHRPVKSIVEAISLNQKFIFIGKLFEGDINAYNKALEELDSMRSFSEAKVFMNNVLAPRYHWITAAEEANDFLDVVARKFQ